MQVCEIRSTETPYQLLESVECTCVCCNISIFSPYGADVQTYKGVEQRNRRYTYVTYEGGGGFLLIPPSITRRQALTHPCGQSCVRKYISPCVYIGLNQNRRINQELLQLSLYRRRRCRTWYCSDRLELSDNKNCVWCMLHVLHVQVMR